MRPKSEPLISLPIALPELLLPLTLVGLGPLPVPEEVPELGRLAAGRVEETTGEVEGMEMVAVPSSTW